jgi:2-C-methyl-D-erythritol 4-phosphate cytidylyltransferase
VANVALIIAGGSGKRMGQDVPKQFLNVEDKPIIVYTMEAFERHPLIDEIVVVCIPGWERVLEAYARQFGISKLAGVVGGGSNGQGSIRNGIRFLERSHEPGDIVLVHDAIRPMVSAEIISDCVRIAESEGSAVSVIPSAEALLSSPDAHRSMSLIDRSTTWRTQTPQGFPLGTLLRMHEEAGNRGIMDSVASCTLAVELGMEVHFCLGSEKNIKLTTVEDIDIFHALLVQRSSEWLKR